LDDLVDGRRAGGQPQLLAVALGALAAVAGFDDDPPLPDEPAEPLLVDPAALCDEDDPESLDLLTVGADSLAGALPESDDEAVEDSPLGTALTAPARESVR